MLGTLWWVLAGILTLGMATITAAVVIRVKKGLKEPGTEPVAAPEPPTSPANGTRSRKKYT